MGMECALHVRVGDPLTLEQSLFLYHGGLLYKYSVSS